MKGNRKGCVSIVQYNTNGTFVNEYNSILEAAITQRIRPTGISKCLRKDSKTYKGYVWRYKDPNHPIGKRRGNQATQKDISVKEEFVEKHCSIEDIPHSISSYSFVQTDDEKALLCNALASAIEWGHKN